MDQNQRLAAEFEAHRARLSSVAYRMVGADADDAVQESWLRMSRADTTDVENLDRWMTTVVARVCLDLLRARKARREELGEESVERAEGGATPEDERLLVDSVGHALMVVLETLAPSERVAFVLHDLFDLPFDEIAAIVDVSSAAARQLASRGRRRVRGAPAIEPDVARQREVVDAFLAASRDGNLAALLSLLDPNVVLRPDRAAVVAGAASQAPGTPRLVPARGAAAVAQSFLGRAQAATSAVIDGAVAAVWAPGGRPRVVFEITIDGGKIVAIDVIAERAHIEALDVRDYERPVTR